MTARCTLGYLAIVAAVASLPAPTTAVTITCDGANVTKPATRQIDKLIDNYARHRAGIAAALSDCR